MLAGREGLIGGVSYSVAIEDFNHKGDESECGDNTARVDGGVVGGVVEDAAEDVVVGEFKEGTERDVSENQIKRRRKKRDGECSYGAA